MITLNFPSLLNDHNVQAFFRVIRVGETWNDRVDRERDELAFRVRYGGWDPDTRRFNPPKYFDSFEDHPRVFELIPDGRKSSAAGAFQETATTVDDMRSRYAGLAKTFTPYDQMCLAVCIIHSEGALEDVVDGRLFQAIRKCANRWASFPDSPLEDGGTKREYQQLHDEYVAWGGSFYAGEFTEAPAPIEERGQPARPEDVERINQEEAPTMGPLAFILPLLQSLFTVFEPLAKAKLNDALNKQVKDPVMSQQMATELMNIVKQAASVTGVVPPAQTGAAEAVAAAQTAAAPPQDAALRQAEEIGRAAQAVAAVKANAELVAQVENDMLDYLDRIAPMIDRIDQLEQKAWVASESSMAAAAQRASEDPNAWDARKVLIGSSVVGVGILVAFVCAILAVQVWRGIEVGVEVWAALTGLIGWVTAKAGTLWDYYFGSSRTSSAKDTAIAELSVRRNR